MSKHLHKALTDLGAPSVLARRASSSIANNKEHIANLYEITRVLQKRVLYLSGVCGVLVIALGVLIYLQSKLW